MTKIIKKLDDTIDAVYDNMSAAKTDSEKCNWSKVADRLVAISADLRAKQREFRHMVRV